MTDIYSLTYEQAEKLLPKTASGLLSVSTFSVTYISAERQISMK